jgi:hypothetical protein
MEFFKNQTDNEKRRYEKMLKIICSLSRLSSESSTPYLYYRMAENIFCLAFSAENLSRSDISIDARKNNVGIGLKTFIKKPSNNFEKIAEFNKTKTSIEKFRTVEERIKQISILRNARLESTAKICRITLSNMLYHCVAREKGHASIYEMPVSPVNTKKVKIKSETKNIVYFTDDLNEYRFDFSKSTLYKNFKLDSPVLKIKVDIHNDPYAILENFFENISPVYKPTDVVINTICLPLYSEKQNCKYVPEKSGLNQWNAAGRSRNPNEIYIPIPQIINKNFPEFFPPRYQEFSLQLPDGSNKRAKVCQDGNKALMTNPNSELGKWLLRDVLGLREAELLKYETLEEIYIDTVQIDKLNNKTFAINVKKPGSFESFKRKNCILKLKQNL